MAQSIKKTLFYIAISFIGFYLFGFVALAKFLPPPSPSLSGMEILSLFDANAIGIRLGMLICTIVAPLYLLWSAIIFYEMKDREIGYPILGCFQLFNGALLALYLMLSPMIWATLAYRIDVSPNTFRLINDFSWIAWIISWPVLFFQEISIGLIGLMDKRTVPIFPRWVAFLSFWAALSMIPAGVIIFVKSGPFAWNGIFGLYLPLAIFVIWFCVLSKYIVQNINVTLYPDLAP